MFDRQAKEKKCYCVQAKELFASVVDERQNKDLEAVKVIIDSIAIESDEERTVEKVFRIC